MARRGGLQVRRVKSADERNISQFFSLPKTGDSFTGIALFSPDPELDDNPGYLEYYDHWDTKDSQYVPCAGPDDCVYCRANDRPSTRAKTLWSIDDNVKIFTLNWGMINEFTDMLSEDEPVLGQEFRVKRLDDRGKYRITPKSGSMTKRNLEKLLNGDALPDLEDLVNSQLRRAYEDRDLASAMEADDEEDDDDNGAEPKARRGRAKTRKAEPEPEEEEAEAEDLEDEEVTIESVSKAKLTIKVSGDDLDDDVVINVDEDDIGDFKKGMEGTLSAEWDDKEEEYALTEWQEAGEEPEEEEPEAEGEMPDKIEDEKFEVVNVDAEEETLDVKNDDYEFTLYFLDEGDASDIDFDDFEDGDTVTISAVKDNEGDMVATEVPEKEKKTTRRRRTASKRK